VARAIFAVWVIAAVVGCSSSPSSTTPAGSGSNASSSGTGGGDGGGTADGSTGYGANSGGAVGGDGSSVCGPVYGTGVSNGGMMTWDSNGSSECALIVEASRTTDSAMDSLDVDGATSSGVAVDIVVASYVGPLGGTYSCATDGGFNEEVIFIYGLGTIADCTVTITQAGSGNVDAQGTFSATGVGDAGTFTITNGVFDVPVTVTDGG